MVDVAIDDDVARMSPRDRSRDHHCRHREDPRFPGSNGRPSPTVPWHRAIESPRRRCLRDRGSFAKLASTAPHRKGRSRRVVTGPLENAATVLETAPSTPNGRCVRISNRQAECPDVARWSPPRALLGPIAVPRIGLRRSARRGDRRRHRRRGAGGTRSNVFANLRFEHLHHAVVALLDVRASIRWMPASGRFERRGGRQLDGVVNGDRPCAMRRGRPAPDEARVDESADSITAMLRRCKNLGFDEARQPPSSAQRPEARGTCRPSSCP